MIFMSEKSAKKTALPKKTASFERLLQIRKQFTKERVHSSGEQEHLMELVVDLGGVSIINNSASVDIDSTWYAMDQIEGKIIWITGGVDRGNNYDYLREIVKAKVKAIIVLGEHNLNVFRYFSQDGPSLMMSANLMDEAVEHAVVMAAKGDTILFSPGCPSYDLYENFEERGTDFKRAVTVLTK